MKLFHIFVDGETLDTAEHKLTARQILDLAKVDPTNNYLVELDGKHQVSYEGKPEEAINIHEKATFVTVSLGPTRVS